MQIYPVHGNDVMGTISSFKISCLLWHPTAVYLIVMPTLTFLNSHSHQNAADTLVLHIHFPGPYVYFKTY